MQDSYLIVYHGPRRGGKTLSMVVQATIDMILGRKVWSLLPIRFNFEGTHYETIPIDYKGLLAQDPEFENGVICWDETALWAYSRNSQAYFNRMLGLILTLIGKMELSLYMTVQFLSLLDKNAKLQMDALIMCTDLSFKYPHLGRGTTIGQLLQDISGRFTGETYEYSEQIYQRTLYGKPFWHFYNTKELFDLKYTLQKITKDDLYGAYEEDSQYSLESKEWNKEKQNLLAEDEMNRGIIKNLIAEFVAASEVTGETEIQMANFLRNARVRGFKGTPAQFDQYLCQLGIEAVGDVGRKTGKYIIREIVGVGV